MNNKAFNFEADHISQYRALLGFGGFQWGKCGVNPLKPSKNHIFDTWAITAYIISSKI